MSKPKKKFKETKVGKFLIDKVPSILGVAGDLFRSEGHLRLKMAQELFVSTLSTDQASRIAALKL